jgi:hypothetical protein
VESSVDMTELMFSYCIDELRYKSKLFRQTGAVTAFDGDVVKSDIVIPSSLKGALRAAVAPLEDVPKIYRDWHPGSNEIVLDLVHPSLFPVVYGRTRILTNSVVGLDDCIKRCGEGETLKIPLQQAMLDKMLFEQGQSYMKNHFSYKFQWLPCEVKFVGERTRYV